MTLSTQADDRSANASTWNPIREIDELFQNMNRLMQATPVGGAAAPMMAVADIEETDDAYIVTLDLPGVQPEDLNVELDGSDLRISGEIKERKREGILRRRQRPVGKFEHVITLPKEINLDNMQAKLADGVLTVRVAKATAAGPRHIEISKG